MICLYTGLPGAGKSYLAVYEIWTLLKNNHKNFLIVTNIEGLKIEDNRVINLEHGKDINDKFFFNADNFEPWIKNLRKDHGLEDKDKIYFFIDECQRYIPYSLKDTKVTYTFEYHRHWGLDFYLITQDSRKISLAISVMAEQETRAVNPRWNLVPGCFTYNLISSGDIYGKKNVKKRKEVFALYKSFQAGKVESKKNAYLIVLFLLVLIIPFWFWRFLAGFGPSPSVADNSTIHHSKSDRKIESGYKKIAKSSVISDRVDNATLPTEKYSLAGRFGEDLFLKEKDKDLIFPMRSIFPAFKIVKYMGDFALVCDNNKNFYYFYRYHEKQNTSGVTAGGSGFFGSKKR